jgi:iron complex transport system substrate-binding protein
MAGAGAAAPRRQPMRNPAIGFLMLFNLGGLRVTALAAIIGIGFHSAAFAADDAYPVVIDHVFGQTTIEARPERIVTIGWMSQDTVLALGEVPAGIPYTTWGGDNDGYYPWVKAQLDKLDQGYPALLNYDDGIPFEDILTLDPDVIIARHSGVTAEEYERLSAIAPTVAYVAQPWSGEWREITRTVGKIMGKSAEAEALVAETEARIAAMRAQHPEFAGRSFTFAGNISEGAGQLAIYVSTDPRVQLLQDMGLTLSDGVKALPTDQGFNIPVSLENLSSVDADIFFAWHMAESGADYVRSNPLISRFRPVAEGRFVSILDRSFVMATSAPSPLSIPFALDMLVPRIAEVLE